MPIELQKKQTFKQSPAFSNFDLIASFGNPVYKVKYGFSTATIYLPCFVASMILLRLELFSNNINYSIKGVIVLYFYHVYGPLEPKARIYQALKTGLTPRFFSTWSTRGGGAFYLDLINRLKSGDSHEWMDFTKSFGVYRSHMNFANYLRFPLANHEIYVFNKDFTTDLFGYVEEEMLIGSSEYKPGMFTDDLPTKEELIKKYWNSRMNLSSYLTKQPYRNPEYLCFHEIPPQLLEGYVNGEKI